MAPAMGAIIAERFKSAGFLFVALDLEGYRQGSLNAALKAKSGG
jgi:PP-loop superfamily ATP-utilizing enzyme